MRTLNIHINTKPEGKKLFALVKILQPFTDFLQTLYHTGKVILGLVS